ncbi:MAG: homoserine O-acetyltransferase, partial [Thermoleophilia bacterium]
RTSFLVVAFTSDWLYPTEQSRALVQLLKRNGLDVSFCEIQSDWGHDAFLLPNERLHALVAAFLSRISRENPAGE